MWTALIAYLATYPAARFVRAEPAATEEEVLVDAPPATSEAAEPPKAQSDFEIEMGGIDSYSKYANAKDKMLGVLPRKSFFIEKRLSRGKNLVILRTSATAEEVRKSFDTVAAVLEADEDDGIFKVQLQ